MTSEDCIDKEYSCLSKIHNFKLFSNLRQVSFIRPLCRTDDKFDSISGEVA